MSKSGFASEKVMRDYLDALLVDEQPASEAATETKPQLESELQPVEQLLQQVNPVQQANQSKQVDQTQAAIAAAKLKAKQQLQQQRAEARAAQQAVEAKLAAESIPAAEPAVELEQAVVESAVQYRQGEFQALFFEVAGLTVAVPLVQLGGIHNMDKLNSLFGKPDWFMGVMLHREQKLSVVNTAKWVMPEKYDIELENSLDYQYIIMLDNTSWGLACEKLVNTVTLQQDEVKWKQQSGRRPWLAGLIKERMCALLDVTALIHMLDNGLSTLDEVVADLSAVDAAAKQSD